MPASTRTAPAWSAGLQSAQTKANTNRRLAEARERDQRRQQRVVAAWLRSLSN